MPSSSRNRTSPIDPEKCVEIAATCACFNFRKVSRTVTQLFDQVLAPLGLRSTQLVILVAAQVFGPVGMTQLARELLMDRSTITRNLRPLVAMGLLKLTGKSGRAGKTVEITHAGQEAIAQAVPYWEKAQRTLLERMGDERWQRMMTDLGSIVDAARSAS